MEHDNISYAKRTKIFGMMIFVVLSMLILIMPMMMAANFDNSKSSKNIAKGVNYTLDKIEIKYNKLWEKYKPIEVNNWYGVGERLFAGVLEEHTEYCFTNCNSIMELYLPKKGVLIEDIKFHDINKDNDNIKAIPYKFYIQTNVSWNFNGSLLYNISWVEYKVGDKVDAGTYKIKLEGKKQVSETIDWVITAAGVDLTEWAAWSGCTENATTVLCQNGTFTGDGLVTSKNIILRNMTANGQGADGGWTIQTTPGNITLNTIGNITIINSTLNGYGGASNQGWPGSSGGGPWPGGKGNITLISNGTIEIINSTLNGYGGSAQLYDTNGRSVPIEGGNGNIFINSNKTVYIYNSMLYGYGGGGSGKAHSTGPGGAGGYAFCYLYSNVSIVMSLLDCYGGGGGWNIGTSCCTKRGGTGGNSILDISNIIYFNNSIANIYGGTGGAAADSGTCCRAYGGAGGNSYFLTNSTNPFISNSYIRSVGGTGGSGYYGLGTEGTSYITINVLQNIFTFSNSTIQDSPLNIATNFINFTNIAGNVKFGLFNSNISENLSVYAYPLPFGAFFQVGGYNNTLQRQKLNWNFPFTIINEHEYYYGFDVTASLISYQLVNCSGQTTFPYLNNFVNMTMQLFNSTGYMIHNETKLMTGIFNYSTFDIPTISSNITTITINCMAYDDASTQLTSQNITYAYPYQTLSESYNLSSYETAAENFEITLVYDTIFTISANLIYNNVSYASIKNGTSNVVTFHRTIDLPTTTSTVNNTWHWNVIIEGTSINTTSRNQTSAAINFTICNSTDSTNVIPYINYTYKDEMLYYYINGSVPAATFNYWLGTGSVMKSYFYSTPIENSSTGFCFQPSNRALNVNYVYQAASLGYVTRTFNSIDNITLTNVSMNKVLYLILGLDSDPVTIQVVDLMSANVVSGARVTITRDIQGNSVTIFDGYTDSAGTVSAFLSSTVSYMISASKAGCGINSQTVTPVGSYSMTLNCGNNLTEYTSFIDGITYQRTPASGVAINPGNTVFGYYITSSVYPMLAARFELYDADGTYLAANETNMSSGLYFCTNSSCLLTIRYYTASGDNIKGRYYVKVGNSTNSTWVLLEKDAYWRYIYINTNNSQQAWKKATLHFNDFMNVWTGGNEYTNCIYYHTQLDCVSIPACKWINTTEWDSQPPYSRNVEFCVLRDDLNKMEFNRVLVIFFGLVVIMFIMGRGIGYEMTNPGSFVAFLSIVIVILSAGGAFTFSGLTPWEWFNQYIYAYICVMFAAGYNLSIIRRYSA